MLFPSVQGYCYCRLLSRSDIIAERQPRSLNKVASAAYLILASAR
jgi:hypothetical protein